MGRPTTGQQPTMREAVTALRVVGSETQEIIIQEQGLPNLIQQHSRGHSKAHLGSNRFSEHR